MWGWEKEGGIKCSFERTGITIREKVSESVNVRVYIYVYMYVYACGCGGCVGIRQSLCGENIFCSKLSSPLCTRFSLLFLAILFFKVSHAWNGAGTVLSILPRKIQLSQCGGLLMEPSAVHWRYFSYVYIHVFPVSLHVYPVSLHACAANESVMVVYLRFGVV